MVLTVKAELKLFSDKHLNMQPEQTHLWRETYWQIMLFYLAQVPPPLILLLLLFWSYLSKLLQCFPSCKNTNCHHHNLSPKRVQKQQWWGGGGLLPYISYRYVPPHWEGFLHRFGLKTGIHFAHFALESGMVFEGTTGLYEHLHCFNSKWARKKEKYCKFEMDLKNFLVCALI